MINVCRAYTAFTNIRNRLRVILRAVKINIRCTLRQMRGPHYAHAYIMFSRRKSLLFNSSLDTILQVTGYEVYYAIGYARVVRNSNFRTPTLRMTSSRKSFVLERETFRKTAFYNKNIVIAYYCIDCRCGIREDGNNIKYKFSDIT